MKDNPYKPELTGIALTRALAEALGWRDLYEKEGWYEDPENGDFEIELYGTNPEGERDQYFARANDVLDALRRCREFCAEYRFVLEIEWYPEGEWGYRAQAAFRDLWSVPVLNYVTNSFSVPNNYPAEADAIMRLILCVLEKPEYAEYRERAAQYREA
jgi:hypothetical protein